MEDLLINSTKIADRQHLTLMVMISTDTLLTLDLVELLILVQEEFQPRGTLNLIANLAVQTNLVTVCRRLV